MEIEQIIKELKKDYIMIPKKNWLYFIGGIFAFLISIGVISYQSAIKAAETKAAKDAIERIEELKNTAEVDVAKIKEELSKLENGPLIDIKEDINSIRNFIDSPELIDLINEHGSFEINTHIADATSGTGQYSQSVSVSLPSDYVLIGGGASSSIGERFLYESKPDGNEWRVASQDYITPREGNVSAYAIGAKVTLHRR